MKIEELKESEHGQASKIVADFWNKEWGFNYSFKDIRSYLIKGYNWWVREHKFFVMKDNKKIIGIIGFVIFEEKLAEINDFFVKEKEIFRPI